MGMYFEEFEAAGEFVTGARVISEADIQAFAELSGDRNAIHLDRAAAIAAGFEGPIAHGALGLSVATGLAAQLGLTKGTLVALVGVNWRFRAPVYPGDAVTLHLRVVSRRATGNPARGLVTLGAELKNQRGEVVHDGEFLELIAKRDFTREVS